MSKLRMTPVNPIPPAVAEKRLSFVLGYALVTSPLGKSISMEITWLLKDPSL